MRVMVLVKASEDSEQGVMGRPEEFAAMGSFNEQLTQAGVLLAADGLQPTSKGKRIRFEGSDRTVLDGPFAETKELVAGFWLWEVESMDEAVQWLKKAPFDGGVEVEIRRIAVAEDFGEAFITEVREAEEQMRREIGQE